MSTLISLTIAGIDITDTLCNIIFYEITSTLCNAVHVQCFHVPVRFQKKILLILPVQSFVLHVTTICCVIVCTYLLFGTLSAISNFVLQIIWFWRALRAFDQGERARFLQFVTGTSKVPLQGFAYLEGMNGTQKFQIHRDDRSTDRLPCAHTW